MLTAFSPAGDLFAVGTEDGRVKTYDTGSGRLKASLGPGSNGSVASTGLLAENHSCIAWVGGRKVTKKKDRNALLALGTAAGDVKLYDAQMGELRWRSKSVIEGGVTALSYTNSESGAVFATGRDCNLVGLELSSGEKIVKFEVSKHPPSCLAMAREKPVALLGGSTLALWDLKTKERMIKYTGHAAPAHAVHLLEEGQYAVSAAPGERHVAVWSTQLPKKAKKAQSAITSLSLEDPVASIDVCPCTTSTREEDGGCSTFQVAAVSVRGIAFVWECSGSGQGEGMALKSRLLARIRVGTVSDKGGAESGSNEGILAARLQTGADGPMLLVARGSTAKPVFEKVKIPSSAASDTEAPTITLEPIAGGILLNGLSTSKEASKVPLQHTRNDVTVLGPENLGQPIVMRVGATDAAVAMGSRKRGAVENMGDEAAPTASAMEEDEIADLLDGEVPLGERVAALEQRVHPSAAQDEEAGPSGHEHQPQGSSKTDSLAVLLTQALRSNDRALLEKCLSATNARVISNTIRRLLPTDAALFLKAAVDRVLSRPARAAQLAPWIKAVMHHHTGYLMSAPGVQAPMTALYQAIEGRVGLYQQLLKVYGRLSLVTAHSSKGSAEGDDEESDNDDGLPAPEVVFEDGSDGEPDAEDPFAPEDDEDEGEEEEEGEGFDDDNEDDDENNDGDDGDMFDDDEE
ncbi:hypothetical protein CEUSTIGMA_g8755.t1 [Chlamydomonas eustigma]|uniref:Small-subunit processome Utp12 domain-containing protein n=1 Tax=Chlamydomonas eustigma TaxID=1157962 RepID=A0A250XE24_9CHLO|nr:hypothetical protein CEUSTIGMA_g8755.t1 [Chlamydomonas eustigma]|eukprot:GAX81324.1 hypothetical protein CEUSTIGMA_g8755.t1 [Chlamydomonas eustigma]